MKHTETKRKGREMGDLGRFVVAQRLYGIGRRLLMCRVILVCTNSSSRRLTSGSLARGGKNAREVKESGETKRSGEAVHGRATRHSSAS